MGIGMIFLGYFGFSVLGLALVPPSGEHYIAQYEMNDLDWIYEKSVIGVSINPAGQLLLEPSSGLESYARDFSTIVYSMPETFEIRLSMEWTSDFTLRVLFHNYGKLYGLILHKDSVLTYANSAGDLARFTVAHEESKFYEYRVVMQSSSYTVLLNDVEIASGVPYIVTIQSMLVYLGMTSMSGMARAHIDYFYAVTGAVYPTYRVNLSGYCDTEVKAVTVQVQADGGQPKSTPCYYDFATGTNHQIVMISSNDVHPFLGWDAKTDKSVILGVSVAGDHVAHFQRVEPTTYTVDVSAYCETEASSVSVNVVSEGDSQFTPHSFTYAIGTSHTILAASQDSNGHAFVGWDGLTDKNTVLSVYAQGSHVATYKQEVVSGTLILVTLTWNGTDWRPTGNVVANVYRSEGSSWVFQKTVTTSASGQTVGIDTNFGVGIYKFEAAWNGITNNTIDEGQAAIGGEYWVTNLYLGHGPINQQNYDWFKLIRDFLASDIGKGFMLYGGVGVTAIGSVLFVYPKAPKFLGFHRR